ncbi:MAG: TolC family protein [Rhodothermales bacterium]|nr:TolC family protein [Rhodothermales bacterium]
MFRSRTQSAFLSIVLLLSLVAGAGSASGQEAPPEDHVLRLSDLLNESRANNPTLRAARLEAEALAERRGQVSALPDPTFMASYQPYPLLTARGTQRTQWRVEQMIPFPGKLGLQGNISDLSSEIAVFEAETLEDDITFRIKQAYFELHRIQQQEVLIRSFQDRLVNFEEVASTQYEVGAGIQQSVLKAQLERNMLERVYLELVERRRTAAEELANLLNRPVSTGDLEEIRVARPPGLSLDHDTLFAVAYRSRPEAAMLDIAALRADTQIALAKKEYLPDFGLNVTYFDVGAADVPPTATGRDALGVGVSIKVPLQRGRLRARLEEARLRRYQVEARQEALESSFRTQIGDLDNRLRQEQRQLSLYRHVLIPQAETTLQATLSAYTTGRTDFLNLLDAERVLFTLNTGYEDTFARYLTVAAALERALGIASLEELDK